METGAKVDVDSLLQELANPNHRVSIARLADLSGLAGNDLAAFVATWQAMDERRHLALVHDLAELTEDNAALNFDSIFMYALQEANAEVRRGAVQALWEHDGRDLIEPLLRLLDADPDAGVRAEAALALGRFALRAEFELLSDTAAQRIDTALQRAVNDPTEPVEVRARALEALGARSQEWVSDLIDEAFAGDDRRLRISAVHAMGRSADPAWLSLVLGQLDSDDEEMRFEAATAAGSIGDPEATPNLIPLLYDEDVEVRTATINALGEIGGDDAKEALQELLTEGDERFKELITEALAEIEFAADPLAFEVGE